jgi:hypothetical protein
MFGTAAPFLGQGGIDPRMVSGPANAYMQQMSSLPIQQMMGGGGFQGFGGGMGGQAPQMGGLQGALQNYQGGNTMPWGQPGGMQGGYDDPRQRAMMAAQKMPGGGFQSGGFQGGQWQPNAINQAQGFPGQSDANRGQWGSGVPSDALRAAVGGGPQSGPGSMPSYLPGGDPSMQQPQSMPSFPMTGGQPQQQPFRPQGPGQRVTQEQLAARGLSPQEIQRKLQQFSGGRLGWQQQGGQGGGGIDPASAINNRPGVMPGQGGSPDVTDPRVQEFIKRMTGNPMGGPGGQPTGQGIARRMPPRGGQQNPNDMVARPIPPMERQRPRGPVGGRGARDNRQQTDVQNIRY